MNETSYPLAWPNNWPRSKYRQNAAFREDRQRLTIAGALQRLEAELGRLHASGWIISTNVQPTLSGRPRSGEAAPSDPGVAVYFTFHKRRQVLACDKWNRVADNIAAIAAHINAIRAVERYGVGTLEQAFAGYQALEFFDWRKILGVNGTATLDAVESTYRALARKYHPDMPEGNAVMMMELTKAISAAREELKR